jgi:hypothetical protein
MSKIPKGASLDVDEILDRYSNIMEVVEQELNDAGVQTTPIPPNLSDDLDGHVLYDEDSGAPLTPDDLTIFTPLVLGKLYSYWTSWTNYYESLLSAAEAKVEVLEEKTAVIQSALSLYYREEEGVAVDFVKDKVTTDVRYAEWARELAKAKQFKRAVMRQHAAFKRTSNNISREQTRRKDEFERSGGLPGAGFQPRGGSSGDASWGRR